MRLQLILTATQSHFLHPAANAPSPVPDGGDIHPTFMQRVRGSVTIARPRANDTLEPLLLSLGQGRDLYPARSVHCMFLFGTIFSTSAAGQQKFPGGHAGDHAGNQDSATRGSGVSPIPTDQVAQPAITQSSCFHSSRLQRCFAYWCCYPVKLSSSFITFEAS